MMVNTGSGLGCACGLGATEAAAPTVVDLLPSMPGYSQLYSVAAGIMYSAGVKQGSDLEKRLIKQGHDIVAGKISEYQTKTPQMDAAILKSMDASLSSADHIQAVKDRFQNSDALLKMAPALSSPDNTARLKAAIEIEAAKEALAKDAEKKNPETPATPAVEPPEPFLNSTTVLLVGGAALLLVMMNKKG